MIDPLVKIYKDKDHTFTEKINIRFWSYVSLRKINIPIKKRLMITYDIPCYISDYILYQKFIEKRSRTDRLLFFCNKYGYITTLGVKSKVKEKHLASIGSEGIQKIMEHIQETYFGYEYKTKSGGVKKEYSATTYAFVAKTMGIDIKTLLHTYTLEEMDYLSRGYIYNKNIEYKKKQNNNSLFSGYKEKVSDEIDEKTKAILDSIPK